MKTTVFKAMVLASSVFAISACDNMTSSSVTEVEAQIQVPELSGFDCIKEFESQVNMLGRGEDYPNFIAKDILEELLKQDHASKLISAKCTDDALFGIKTATIKNDGENQQVLDYLEATFPLDLVVFNGEENWRLDADIKYEVSGLATKEKPELVKHFIVNQSYDMNGNVLKKIFVKE